MPAHGDRKIFYGWKADSVGAGNGAIADQGGFFKDAAIADESYPNKDARITSVNAAVAECLSSIRRMQRHGLDAGGTIWYQVFGSESDDPVRAPEAADPGVGQAVKLMSVDLPEHDVVRAVNLSNKPKSDAYDTNLDFQQNQEYGGGV